MSRKTEPETPSDPSLLDVAIIGGGPAGISAAIYTARAGLKTLVLDKGLMTGALGITGKIANYPGVPEEISGADLLERMRSQARTFGAEIVTDRIVGVELTTDPKTIFGNNGTYTARAVIIASGAMGRGNRIRGEDELLGRGVSYCATCDAAFFRGREVAVVGNDDEAVEEGLYLTKFASLVHFLSPTPDLKASPARIRELEEAANVTFYRGVILREVQGESKVSGLRFAIRGKPEQILPVEGAFIYMQGSKPVTDFLVGQLEITPDGYLNVDAEYQTALPGVFAVGDVLKQHIKQAIVAAAEGAVAGMAVDKLLHHRRELEVDWSK